MKGFRSFQIVVTITLVGLGAGCPDLQDVNTVTGPLDDTGTDFVVDSGSRQNIPFTQLFGCGQADGFSGFSGGQGTLNEFGTLGTEETGPIFSIAASAPNGTESFASGSCEAFGRFAVQLPEGQTREFGNIDAILSTNCNLSENINGYKVFMYLEIRGDLPEDNRVEVAQFCYSVFGPGTDTEIVDCDEPYTGDAPALIFLSINDYEFRRIVSYSVGARLRVSIATGEATPEQGGSIDCTMSVEHMSVCLGTGCD